MKVNRQKFSLGTIVCFSKAKETILILRNKKTRDTNIYSG